MGKRSGVPHRQDELEQLNASELQAQLDRAEWRLGISGTAKVAKQWQKRIHWLKTEIEKRKASIEPL